MSWRFRIFSGVLLLVSALVSWRAGAQHAVGATAFEAAAGDAKRFQLAPGLKLDVWAAEPQLSNSVAFAFDGKGRVYLAESDRWAISVFDITAHTNWLWQDMSFRNVAERGAFLTNQFATNLAFLTKDSEVVRRVEDRDGDGKADHTEILATGFTNAVDGTAAGVLATREGIYFANIPSLWRLSGTGVIGGSVTSNQSATRQPSTDSLKTDPLITRSPLATGFGVHIGVSGHDLHGLIKGPDGRIYMSFGDRGCVLTNREGVVINLPDTGGVLRCEPDGRHLEVFCYGLRNPQELAFDDFGNLWTVDNDTAGTDPCRVLHLVEGGDYGWRTSYQHMDGFGPWVQEELWKGGQDGILPPAGTVSQGPSGLAFYPGTGFGERLAGTFLHADFPGGVWAYTVKPQGASYVVDRKEKFLWNCWPTDVDFGPDGAAYVLDWVSGWGQTPRGRIYRITPTDVAAEVTRRTGSDATNESASSRRRLPEPELIAQVKQLLAEGMTQRGEKELLDLLDHADRRVRLEAQWELAERGTNSFSGLIAIVTSERNQLQRIHALWAIGQIVRSSDTDAFARELSQLLPLLSGSNPEIVVQAIRTVSEGGLLNAFPEITKLLNAQTERVKVAATLALEKLYSRSIVERYHPSLLQRFAGNISKLSHSVWATTPAIDLSFPWAEFRRSLSQRATMDPVRILAAARALEHQHYDKGQGRSWLDEAADDEDANIRLIALLTFRRQYQESVLNFLSDPDPRLIVAAGRAIHDVPIVEGFPALAAFITKIDCPTNLMSRVINACYRLGTQQHAQMLAGFAGREDVPDWARVLAMQALADWEKPSPLDRVNGLWRPLKVGQAASLPAAPVSLPVQLPAQPDSASAPASPSPRPSPSGRGGNAASASGNEAVQVAATPSPSGENPSLTSAPALSDSSTRPNASPSPGGEGRGEGGPSSRSAVPSNPLLERAAQAQAARNLGRAAEIPVLPADLGRSVPYEEAMALRRNPAPAQRAFLRVAGDLMNPFNLNEAGQPAGTREVLPLQIAVAEAAAKLRVKEAGTPLFEKFAHTNTAPELRRALLPALAELRSPLTGDAVKLALADSDPKLRATALPYLDRLDGDAVDLLASLVTLRGDDLALAQAALSALANLPDLKAKAVLRRIVTDDANYLPRELLLDVLEAARVSGISDAKPAPAEMLLGGNAERGRQVFFQNQTVQCLRCHKVGADGGTVGPELTGVGKRQSRDYLLESILQPNAKIAAGFETVVLTLNDGSTVAGALKSETASELGVEVTGDDGQPALTRVAKSALKQRERGPSAMPEGLGDQLTAFELRDLVEYLATLK